MYSIYTRGEHPWTTTRVTILIFFNKSARQALLLPYRSGLQVAPTDKEGTSTGQLGSCSTHSARDAQQAEGGQRHHPVTTQAVYHRHPLLSLPTDCK